MSTHLTDRSFWKAFWESKKDILFKVPSNYMFSEILSRLVGERTIESAIELGGFPGYYSVFLKKYLKLDTTLLDYFVHEEIIKAMLEENELDKNDIAIIEADLFSYSPQKQFDLVLSFGLIEHFNDIKDIISRHLPFLKPGGTLFITLPNFKGVNGWVQQTFDKENYDKHNISSMDPVFLELIARELGLKDVKAGFYGNFSVWLENKKEKSVISRGVVKVLWFCGKVVTTILPFKSAKLSPYITLEARL